MLNIPLQDSTFRDIRDYIYDKSGIYITDTKKYLIENRLMRILSEKNLNSFEEYFNLVKFSTNGNELSRLFDAVTTNETYFFREIEQLKTVADELIPKLISLKKGSKPLKIWSAACSTGEEPYTLSIMLLDKGYNEKNYEIFASDLSEGVLSSAKRAIYNSYSVRNVPPFCLNRYFSGVGESYALNEVVKKTVKFTKINLIDNKSIRLLGGMDVIFCRNVLIYFDVK